MSAQGIEKIRQGEATIIDVRSPGEYRSGHVEGSLNIPLQEIETRLGDISVMKKPIIVCCASGGRSGQAEYYLSSHGVEQVYNGGSWYEVQSILTL
jgi:phage shock protein E